MLTRKQLELLLFINERLKEEGVPPSFEEMKDALNLQSKSGVHRLIVALEERGFLKRMANRARALEVIKLPESHSPSLTSKKSGFSPNVTRPLTEAVPTFGAVGACANVAIVAQQIKAIG